MKSSDKPEISKKWWLSEKPSTIKGADLEKALAATEKALAEAEKKEDADSIKAALAALGSLSSAVDKTIKKECDKKKDKDLITVLGKYDDVIGDEVKELEKAQSALGKAAEKLQEGEDEESDNKLFTPDYLIKMIRLLKTGAELKFCFGLNKSTPEDSRLVLDRKRDPERLMKMLKATGDFSNRLMTYGYATGDGKILQFRLAENAKEPSQIVKLAKVYLKKNRELKFKKIKVLLPSGEGFEEDMPEDEQEVQAAGGTSPQNDLRKLFKQARKKWVAVHDKAEQDLEMVKDGVRNHYIDDAEQFPIAVKKLKELDDIMDNLNHDLRDALDEYAHTPLNKKDRLHELAANARQIVDSFADYVEGSDLLTAIDQKEFADVQIKAPLSAALRELEKTLA
jgi:hypothetical protein